MVECLGQFGAACRRVRLAGVVAWFVGGLTMGADSVRPAAVAGSFYPGDAEALRRAVKGYLDAVPAQPLAGEVVAAIAPHAGYRYSAGVAAYTYRAMQGVKADTVVIIGHDAHARGIMAVLSDATAFETPLGRVAVDTELVAALCKAQRTIIVHNQVHRRDHTVEVHLPFLQTVLPGCRIVPVLFGEPSVENCRLFAEALLQNAGERKLFVMASTDLSHYPPQKVGADLDRQTMNQVQKLDVAALLAHLEKAVATPAAENVETAMCASGGVGTAVLYARARGATSLKVLHLGNSGEAADGDTTRVVGYAAAVLLRPEPVAAPEAAGEGAATNADFSLPKAVQDELLALARRRISTAVRREPCNYAPPAAMQAILNQPAAVFVTLHKAGRLRGCIGTTTPRAELWRAVMDLAHSAAFEDPRFSAVREDELASLHLEISVLSPLTPVSSAATIVPNRHGVVVRRGARSGLFLPQVWQQIPDKDQFLSVLCSEKAGLPEDAWKSPETRLLVFTVFAFEEH